MDENRVPTIETDCNNERVRFNHSLSDLKAESHLERVRRERQAEQAVVEATREYQLEQLFRDLEEALDALDRITEEHELLLASQAMKTGSHRRIHCK